MSHGGSKPSRERSRGAARDVGAALISVVIPCYNEEEVLPALRSRLGEAAEKWGGRALEVVLVDDGSRDCTWDLIESFHAEDPRWKGVRLARNFGHQRALWVGLHHCHGDVIVVMDADLQDPPEVVDRFLAHWQQGNDVIYAVRDKRKEGPAKRAAYRVYYRVLAALAEVDIPLDSGDFCVIDRRVLDAMLQTHEQPPFIRGLRAWVGFRRIAVPYDRDARAAGRTKYTFAKLMQLGLDGIFSFSTKPLRLATYLGFAASGAAFIGAIWTMLQRLFPEAFEQIGLRPWPHGLPSIFIALLFLGGTQLICVGILGEYISRIYQTVRRRPAATISDRLGVDERPGRMTGSD
jgi:dolichol-phosphate mannosyltransferase